MIQDWLIGSSGDVLSHVLGVMSIAVCAALLIAMVVEVDDAITRIRWLSREMPKGWGKGKP